MTKYISRSKYENDFSSNKPLLITLIVDNSPSTTHMGFGNTNANALINKHLKRFINQLIAVPKILANAYIRILTYSSDVKDLFGGFTPLYKLKNNIPHIEAVKHGGTRTMAAINDGVEGTHKFAKEITALSGCDLYTSVLCLLTDGDDSLHDTEEYREQVIKKVNECTKATGREEKILPIIVALGDRISDNTRDYLSRLSEGFINGHFCIPSAETDSDTDFSKLFEFISKSITASIGIDSVEVLIDELRNIVDKNYSHMVYPRAS